MSEPQRRAFQEAVLDADSFEDLPGKWQAAILKAEESRPKLARPKAWEVDPRPRPAVLCGPAGL